MVDDGSNDGTGDIAARYGDQIRYVRQSNSGAPTARNLGLSLGIGKFVAFLDADDLWHPEKLARQMARFEARPELDYCVTHLQRFWISQLEAEKHSFQNHRFAEVLPGYVTQTLLVRRKPRFVTQDQNKQDVGDFFWSLKKWRDSQRQKARN